jgi:CubicO group peptidase (beta-lactamase class C family)
MLLGRIVETVSDQPLDAFVQTRLYGPLGLTDTGFRQATGPPGDRTPAVAPPPGVTGAATAPTSRIAATSHGNPFEYRMVHDSTFGYRIEGNADAWNGWRRRTLVGEVNDGNAWHAFGGVAGHAGLFSTAADLQVLLGVLMNRGAPEGGRVLTAEVVTTFLTEQVDGQALGWQLPDYAPDGSFTHTGFTGTWVLGVPETGLAVVLLTNRQNGGVDGDDQYPDVGPLQRAVASALLGSGR